MTTNATSNVFKIDTSTESEAGFTMRPGWYVETSTGTKGPFKTKREATATVNETTKASEPAKAKGGRRHTVANEGPEAMAEAIHAAMSVPHRTTSGKIVSELISAGVKPDDPEAVAEFLVKTYVPEVATISRVVPILRDHVPSPCFIDGKAGRQTVAERYGSRLGLAKSATSQRKEAKAYDDSRIDPDFA